MVRSGGTKGNASVGAVWKSDSVKDVAESIGIGALTDEVAQALAGDVEYRLWDLIEEASKFMLHARRSKLKVEDVDQALRVRNFEPLWGFNSTQHIPFRKAVTNTGTVYALEDEEIDLNKVLKADSIQVPRPVSFTAHWLAIEGVQPLVKENPTPQEIAKYARHQQLLLPQNTAAGGSNSAASAAAAAAAAAAASSSSASQPNGTTLTPLVKHVLSKELQLYFTRLTEALSTSDNPQTKEAALGSIRTDPGLHQLVPYLISWANEEIANKLSDDLAALERALDLFNAMFDNPTLFVEPYLHQIVPAILTCILTSSMPSVQPGTYPNSYQIRSTACSLLSMLMNRYSAAYPSLRPRIIKTLLRGLGGPDRGLGSRWGAAHALSALLPLQANTSGSPVIRDWLGSGLKALGEMITNEAAHQLQQTNALPDPDVLSESKDEVVREVVDVLRASLVNPASSERPGAAAAAADASTAAAATGTAAALEDLVERYGNVFGRAVYDRWSTGGREIWEEVSGVANLEDEDDDEEDEAMSAAVPGVARGGGEEDDEEDDEEEEEDEEDEEMS